MMLSYSGAAGGNPCERDYDIKRLHDSEGRRRIPADLDLYAS